jgi:uncharacterized membrane protein (DUF485 family)
MSVTQSGQPAVTQSGQPAVTQSGQPAVTQSGQPAVSGYEAVHVSREFRTLRRRYGYFAIPAIVLFLSSYFLFVIIAAFAPGFMRIEVAGDVNIGLCFGALQFAIAFVITATYRRWARRNLDPLSDRLRQRLETGRRR